MTGEAILMAGVVSL